MKNIDFKSLLIGALLMTCVFLFIGQRSFNDEVIKVKIIKVKNSGGP